jgi:hypothetical protein
LLLIFLAGCNARPRPPALQQNEAFFHDQREGLRFTPPAGWIQHGRAKPPREDGTHEFLLVKYKRLSEPKAAFLEVWVKDLPATADLSAYMDERLPARTWRRSSRSETVEVGRLPAIREAFSGYYDKDRFVKEVVAVRRGERVYFFTGIFPTSDDQARDQVRQAVESTVWEATPKT